jgi:hypothetical protein
MRSELHSTRARLRAEVMPQVPCSGLCRDGLPRVEKIRKVAAIFLLSMF